MAGTVSKAPARPAGRVALLGTGAIGRSVASLIVAHRPDLALVAIHTRRRLDTITDSPAPERLTRSLAQCIEQADVVLECSGDVGLATEAAEAACAAGRPFVSLNTEFHVTTGSHFVGRGLVTEAEGDQPGSTAALAEEARAMGFRPLVYGNIKGFLNPDPTPADMAMWAERQGISVLNTTGATDGTKLQMEQALIANGLGAGIARRGLVGPAVHDLQAGAEQLARIGEALGRPIADYILSNRQVPGVFIVARHDDDQARMLRYYKLGDGPYYVLVRPYHLCSLEVAKTLRRVLDGGGALVDNSAQPRVGVIAVAKRRLEPGTRIVHGHGGFEVRGEAASLAEVAGHVPIGALHDAVVRRRVDPGQMLRFEDVDLPDNRVTTIARALYGSDD
jgi:predicted homoserine dehydrogenase-like protein